MRRGKAAKCAKHCRNITAAMEDEMRYIRALAMAATIGLSGCAVGNGAGPDGVAAPLQSACEAENLQHLVGQKATEILGAQVLQSSGARTLRWGPPRSAWTMDYRTDRVNISYDDAMIIQQISCG